MNTLAPAPVTSHEVRIPSGDARLPGDLTLPASRPALGLVLFAHGTGSGRHSAPNRRVAEQLQRAGVATLLFDLLTAQEEQTDMNTSEHRFDMALLTRRLQDATTWVLEQPELAPLPLGYFGASTGSAAAIIAAARLGNAVAALVSRGGRPDLAGPVALAAVTVPTLLIVGSADHGVMALNEASLKHLNCHKSLAIIPGATHFFEERGTLEQVGELTASWFAEHFTQRNPTHFNPGKSEAAEEGA